jgi:hypothetical protein
VFSFVCQYLFSSQLFKHKITESIYSAIVLQVWMREKPQTHFTCFQAYAY